MDFREVQTVRNTSPLVWYLTLAGGVVGIWVAFAERRFVAPWVSLLIVVFSIGLVVFIYLCGLIVEVRREALAINFTPIRRQLVPYHTILRCYVRTFNPVREFLGWGWKWWEGKSGKAFTMSGTRGVQLELKGGRRLLIGSQQPERLCEAIERAIAGTGGPWTG